MLSHLPDIYVLNFGILLFVILLALSIIDVKSYLLPNFLTLPLIPAGIAQGWVLTQDWKSGMLNFLPSAAHGAGGSPCPTLFWLAVAQVCSLSCTHESNRQNTRMML